MLILTTDGKTSFTVRSKKNEEEYYVQVDGVITDKAILALKNGIEIGMKGIIVRGTVLSIKASIQ